MSQICPKSDPSFFSDITSPKNFISYPHNSYQCSQNFNKSRDPAVSVENNHIFKSDDDSSNSVEDMDAVERFCNLSQPNDQKDIVNKDSTVNTMSDVDSYVDVTNGCVTAQNEGVIEEEEDESQEQSSESEQLLDTIKSSEKESQGLTSELKSYENSTESLTADSNDTHGQDCSEQPSSHLTKTRKKIATVVEEDLTARIIEEYEEVAVDPIEDSENDSKVTSPGKRNRPMRLRAPSLKLIEAAGGAPATKDYCSKSKSLSDSSIS